MFANPYRSEVSIRLGDQDYIVWYGWNGIALLQSRIGHDFDVKIGEAIQRVDLPVISLALSIGLYHRWPEMTPERIFELSPPLAKTTEAITTGLRVAFHGTREVPGEPVTNPPRSLRSLRRGILSAMSFGFISRSVGQN